MDVGDWGKGTSVHPTATRLMLVPVVDAQSLEKYYRSAGKHLKSSTKKIQPVNQLHEKSS